MFTVLSIAALVFACIPLAPLDPQPKVSVSLKEAIAQFNEKAAQDEIGKEQPALTEAEVIAAIRYANLTKDMPVSDRLFAEFKQIAESRVLPPHAQFEVLTGYDPGGAFVFDAWFVRIRMDRPDGSSYAFMIRERMVGSRSLEEELTRIEKKLENLGATQPLPGTSRVYERVNELKARIAKLKAN